MVKEMIKKTNEIQERRDFLIDELIKYGVYEGLNNRQLYELRLSELEQMHIEVKWEFGRQMDEES